MTNVANQPIIFIFFQTHKLSLLACVRVNPFQRVYSAYVQRNLKKSLLSWGFWKLYYYWHIFITIFLDQSRASILSSPSSSSWSLLLSIVAVLLGKGLDGVHRKIPGIRDVQEPSIRPALFVPWTGMEESVVGSFVSVSVSFDDSMLVLLWPESASEYRLSNIRL